MFARNLNKFKLITFDCTNTLLYFKVPPCQMYLKTAIEMGCKKEIFDSKVDMLESFRKNFKNLKKNHPNFGTNSIGYEQWWTKLVTQVLTESSNNQINSNDCEKVAKRLIKKYETEECWEKFNKADDLIAALKQEKKVIGVISNFDPRLHNLLTRMELLDFNFEITSYEAKIEKPNPEIFNYALREADKIKFPALFLGHEDEGVEMFKPYEALHIGNEKENDVEAARKAGWSSILIAEDGDFKSIEELYTTLNTKYVNL